MYRFTLRLLFSALLLSTPKAQANDNSFVISPSLGKAVISNPSGYKNTTYVRVDGGFFPQPEFGLNVFASRYSGFETSAGNIVSIGINGYGLGLTGQWPFHPRAQPYVRVEYMLWKAEAEGLDRTLAVDNGGSAGLAAGVQIPVNDTFGITAELGGYNNVSGADIRHLSIGLEYRF